MTSAPGSKRSALRFIRPRDRRTTTADARLALEKSSESGIPCGQRATPAARLAQRPRQIAAVGHEPAVVGPMHGIEQRLAAQRPEAVLVAVIDQPPGSVRRFDGASHGRATTTSPRAETVRTIGLFGAFSHGPWIDRERATITMCPVGGPAVPPDGEDQVEPLAMPQDLRPFGREGLDDPTRPDNATDRRHARPAPSVASPSSVSARDRHR